MKLHNQVKLHQLREAEALRRLRHFRDYLHGSKFTGYDHRDGERKDYIRTHEVLAHLRELDYILDGVDDDLLVQESGVTLS